MKLTLIVWTGKSQLAKVALLLCSAERLIQVFPMLIPGAPAAACHDVTVTEMHNRTAENQDLIESKI